MARLQTRAAHPCWARGARALRLHFIVQIRARGSYTALEDANVGDIRLGDRCTCWKAGAEAGGPAQPPEDRAPWKRLPPGREQLRLHWRLSRAGLPGPHRLCSQGTGTQTTSGSTLDSLVWVLAWALARLDVGTREKGGPLARRQLVWQEGVPPDRRRGSLPGGLWVCQQLCAQASCVFLFWAHFPGHRHRRHLHLTDEETEARQSKAPRQDHTPTRASRRLPHAGWCVPRAPVPNLWGKASAGTCVGSGHQDIQGGEGHPGGVQGGWQGDLGTWQGRSSLGTEWAEIRLAEKEAGAAQI